MFSQTLIDLNREKLERALRVGLVEHSSEEVRQNLFRMRNVEWGEKPEERSAAIRALPEDLQAFIWNEIQMSKIDWRYWATRYCKLVDSKGKMSILNPWPSQEMLLALLAKKELETLSSMERRDFKEFQLKLAAIVLKARQLGFTVISESILVHAVCFFSNTRAVIASDHPDNSLKLWQVALRMYEHLPPWMQPIKDAKVKATNLHLSDLDSDIIVGSGNQKTTLGQGITLDMAHLTELASWIPENTQALDADLLPAFKSSQKHHSILVMESTAEGGKGNYFHDIYQAARTGRTFFSPLFVGWFAAPEKWRMDPYGVTVSPIAKLYAEKIEREWAVKLTRDQVAWYSLNREEAEVRGNLATFLQEFPSTPEEAFQSGKKSAFTPEVRLRLRNEAKEPLSALKWDKFKRKFSKIDKSLLAGGISEGEEESVLLLWELPTPGSLYIVGVDVSYGDERGDSSAIEVIRVGSRWIPDEQVAEWRGIISPVDLAELVWFIGHMFADKEEGFPAKVAVETNPGSPGLVTQTELQKRGYPNFYVMRQPNRTGGGWTTRIGWWTTPGTRPMLTENGVQAIEKGTLKINSRWFVDEMDQFVVNVSAAGNKKLEHSPGEHDDRIMSLFIARYVAHEMDSQKLAEDRLEALERRNRPPEETIQFQQLGVSWEQAMRMWEEANF